MGAKIQTFFENNDYFIDEKVALFKFTNAYRVYDSSGNQIGTIKESMPAHLKILSFIMSKAHLPFKLDIMDAEDRVLATIKRGWTFFMSKIEVLNAEGTVIAHIRQKFALLKPTFTLLDPGEQPLAQISGDWKAWNFVITDSSDTPIGSISKKWNGVLKEAFTTADKYIVSINPEVVDAARKIPIVAAAITIDMVLKESK
ncbi:RNAse [Spirochaetia bacterium]|nr:RNAse [Spirochaetia bacterium]